jgi:hypothetical protein
MVPDKPSSLPLCAGQLVGLQIRLEITVLYVSCQVVKIHWKNASCNVKETKGGKEKNIYT